MTSPPILTIDLLRHGHTDAKAGCLYGATDVPLSEAGKEQLMHAFTAIHQEPISHVVSSPLQRCAWLAKIASKTSLTPITATFELGFKEMDFGDWEGCDIQTLIEQKNGFQHDASKLFPPNGESFAVFASRVRQTWENYIHQHIQQGGHHLLVTHGGVMRVLIGAALHIPEQHLGSLFIPHASWSRISFVQGEKPMLWFMNRCASENNV